MLIEVLESREMFAVTPVQPSVATLPATPPPATVHTEIQGRVWTGVYDRSPAANNAPTGAVWTGVYDRSIEC